MVWIPEGDVTMGAVDSYPEESPTTDVTVNGFWIATHEVTNLEFRAFVSQTGYVTLAQRQSKDGTTGGGAVFGPGDQVRDWSDIGTWWRFDARANWLRPRGEPEAVDAVLRMPVVQIAFEDALAYARWRGHDLPSEAEWERAARGGLVGARYTWGNEKRPDGRIGANHWQGAFPLDDSGEDGHRGRAPVGCFPANGFGLYDMAGNVWEWTSDPWREAGSPGGFRVIKGGSFLCSDTFCGRYRPAARQAGEEAFSTEHLGFRTVWRGPPPPDR
jgi:sulfatase modifying factor 1